jgi:NAD(P)H dehydrogenase (quinone)
MFAITGITGNVGGEVARNLLTARQPIRGVMRDVLSSRDWAQQCRELSTTPRRLLGRSRGQRVSSC